MRRKTGRYLPQQSSTRTDSLQRKIQDIEVPKPPKLQNTQSMIKSEQQGSRMLRANVQQKNQTILAQPKANASSLERNWTYFSLSKEYKNVTSGSASTSATTSDLPSEPIDMEKVFQVEPSLHLRKHKTVKVANKAILPDIFNKQTEIESKAEEALQQELENQPPINQSEQHTQEKASQLEDTLKSLQASSQVVDRSSIKPPRQNRTERTQGSQSRLPAQQKSLIIKPRPSSATRRLTLQETDSQEKRTNNGLQIIRSQTSLIKQEISPPVQTLENPADLLSKRPPKQTSLDIARKKNTARSTSKGSVGAYATAKSKRYSIVAPSKDVQFQVDGSESKTEFQSSLQRMFNQEKRYLDLPLWQSIERTSQSVNNALFLSASIWNHLSKARLALPKCDPEQVADFSPSHLMSDWFYHLCVRQGIPDSSRVLMSHQKHSVTSPKSREPSMILDICKNLKMPIKTKVHVLNKSKLIVGYEVMRKADGQFDVMLITARSCMEDGQIFQNFQWQDLAKLDTHIEEFSLGMNPL